MAVMSAASCSDDAPPFSFILRDSEMVLLERSFSSYAEAIASGSYVVTLSSGNTSMDITKEVGFCASAAPCAGPMTIEALTLTLNPDRPDHILTYYCEGLDGALMGGLDVMGTGACARRQRTTPTGAGLDPVYTGHGAHSVAFTSR
jgi:hypothetical protein